MTICARIQVTISEPSDRDSYERLPMILQAIGGSMVTAVTNGKIEFEEDEFQALKEPFIANMTISEPLKEGKVPEPDKAVNILYVVFRDGQPIKGPPDVGDVG